MKEGRKDTICTVYSLIGYTAAEQKYYWDFLKITLFVNVLIWSQVRSDPITQFTIQTKTSKVFLPQFSVCRTSSPGAVHVSGQVFPPRLRQQHFLSFYVTVLNPLRFTPAFSKRRLCLKLLLFIHAVTLWAVQLLIGLKACPLLQLDHMALLRIQGRLEDSRNSRWTRADV